MLDTTEGGEPGVDDLKCYRHPRRTTVLACMRCDRPICTRCALEAPVGFQCRDCPGAGFPAGDLDGEFPGYRTRRTLLRVVALVALAGLLLGGVLGAGSALHW